MHFREMKEKQKTRKLDMRVVNIVAFIFIVFTIIFPFIQTPYKVAVAENTRESVRNMQVNAGGDEAVTGEVIDNWMQNDSLRKGSRLDGYGDMIVQVADKYGVNRAFFVALMDAETSLGVHPCFGNDYNFGCIRGHTANSVEEGLETLGKQVANYINGTVTSAMVENPTIQQLTDVYAPAFENDHDSRFANHGAVFGFLGVDADEMQNSGDLKNGDPSIVVDYSPDEPKSLAASCPINCDLDSEQRVNDYNNGANTGNIQILPEGKLWKNESNIQETDLGYTTDQATRENLTEFLEENGVSDAEEYAGYFYEAGQSSGLDPRFLYAFWSVNTKNGTEEAWTSAYNAFGWSTGENFTSEKDGIIEGSKLVSINYYNEGQNTLKKMVEDDSGHIVSADENWAKAVASIMQKSEDFMGESEGKLPDDMAVTDKNTWIYEQCYGDGGTGMNISGGNYTEQVINVLRDEGFTDESIAGILGNMQKESYVNPLAVQGLTPEEFEPLTDEERDNMQANASTTGAYALGIVQWEDARFAKVRAKASELGVSPYSMEPQMIIAIQEMKDRQAGSYGSGTLYDLYQVNTDVYQATASFAQIFEGCAACKSGTNEFAERNAMSMEFYATYF